MENFVGEFDLAVRKQNAGKLDDAEKIYLEILKRQPGNSDALHLLGLVAYQKGEMKKAVELICRAIEIKSHGIYYFNLGIVCGAAGDEKAAVESFEKFLEIAPNDEKAYIAYYNLGIYFKDAGNFEKALEYYDMAIELKSDFFDAQWNRGIVLLLLGRFEEGWKDYECRFRKASPTDTRKFAKPKWEGDSLKGKRILILSEQGFGDNIQFVRFLKLLKERGGYVIFECRKELRKLFEGFEGIDEFVEKGSDLSNLNYDFCVHLLSLLRIFKIDLKNIPREIPYLKSLPEFSEKFNSLFDSEKFKIGIVWSGNSEFVDNKEKSANFEMFESLKKSFEDCNVEWFSLQKGKAAEELNADSGIVDLSEKMNDFADTAGIIENLDLVIAVDTAVAHLAGAMGKPVWVLLSKIPDWRWLLERNDSPWYSTMKLFRQKEKGNWKNVFENVRKELERVIS